MNKASAASDAGDFDETKRLVSEVVYGVSAGNQTDPGMAGSLLYHMAMVTKMAAETRFLLQEFQAEEPQIYGQVERFYGDFVSDVIELSNPVLENTFKPNAVDAETLGTDEKIALFLELAAKTKKTLSKLENKTVVTSENIESLFQEWGAHVIEMRLRQEYETIKGLLTTTELAKTYGIQRLQKAMERVQEKFGEETVNIALDVTLKVGMRREKLQTVMLSDHFIEYRMNIANLDGNMQFFNCPVAGSHRYIADKIGLNDAVAALFCKHFCYAHAKAMLETVLPFTFTLSQPQRIATHGKCEFYMKLADSPSAKVKAEFIPLVVSWNVTRKCNLACSHCYINAAKDELQGELNTEEAKRLIDQISYVSRPLLILSGGEPLLRADIYDLIQYGADKGLRMGLGSNGSLINQEVAKNLKAAGVKTVSISLDSRNPEKHDEFRGVKGSWQKAVEAITALRQNGVLVQVNTTVTQQNHNEIDEIMSLAEELGVENFHLFFLVPTGRGTKITDISPAMYEGMIKSTFAKTGKHRLNVRPSCAPQFMRIAKNMGLDMRQWIRGCIAGLYYCRIYPNGDITPCPYLPVKLGNVREKTFGEIWFGSEVFRNLRDFDTLKGKCGACEYRSLCGGCRARAYGLSSDFIDFCGDLHEPAELKGDYLKEDPWCVYQPRTSATTK
ncbi:MAG TPA: radical SAM protein [Candidatus Bathyarchaeia archaeon]|nr:radical SAM protein [Candidatus Bathyarchaeia archaeon]